MEQPATLPPRTAGSRFRRAAVVVCGLAISTAAVLGVGQAAWWVGGLGFLAIGLSKFPLYRPSRWRLAQATNPWWATPSLGVMLVLASFASSAVFHSFGLMIRALWSRAT
jgi:hypothetical protein